MSGIPIPALAMDRLSRELVCRALTGREERDFLSPKTKISKHSLPTSGFHKDLSNLFPERKEKDQFTRLVKSQEEGDPVLKLPV